jgi:predicted ArsR family transcriptional regulator
MTTLQRQARALGDPSRHELFRYLVDADRDVGVAELTEHLGLNHNAIRQHLAKLLDAELVTERRAAPSGPGRPRLVYRVDPRADGRWGARGPYERLSLLLAEVLRTGDAPEEVGRREGRRRRLGEAEPGDGLGVLVEEMARQGFDPELREHGEQVEVVLRTCPFASTALADPETVCGLHLGIAHGIAETTEGLAVEALVPRDPRQAQCRLRCRRLPAAG